MLTLGTISCCSYQTSSETPHCIEMNKVVFNHLLNFYFCEEKMSFSFESPISSLKSSTFSFVRMWPQLALNQSRETTMTSSCCSVLCANSTLVHLILLHQQMEWIGFAQGSWFLVIKVYLKRFAGFSLQLILPATMGSVKSKHHKNSTHGPASHSVDTPLSHFHLQRNLA